MAQIYMSNSSSCSPEQNKYPSSPHWEQSLHYAIPQTTSYMSLEERWLAWIKTAPRID